MKRITALIICLCMTLALAACGGKNQPASEDSTAKQENEAAETEAGEKEDAPDTAETEAPSKATEITEAELKPGEKTVTSDAELTLIMIYPGDKLEASFPGRPQRNYTEGEIYLDAVFNCKYTGPEDVGYLMYSSILSVAATGPDGTEYSEGFCGGEGEDGTLVEMFTEVEPGVEKRIHCVVSVPNVKEEYTLKFTASDKILTCKYTPGELFTTAKEIKQGDTVEEPGFGKFTYNGYHYTMELKPSDQSGSYYSNPCQDPGCIFLAVGFTYTNETDEEQNAERIMCLTSRYEDNITGYNEWADGFCFEYGFEGDGIPGFSEIIEAHGTRAYYYLMPVAEENEGKPGVVQLHFAGQDYYINIG